MDIVLGRQHRRKASTGKRGLLALDIGKIEAQPSGIDLRNGPRCNDVQRLRLLLRFCDEAFQPAEHALPAFSVGFGLVEISSETFLRDAHLRARA